MDLAGQRGEELVLEHLALPVLEEDALVGRAFGDPRGEPRDRFAAFVVDHVDGDDRAGLPVDPVVLLAGGERVGEVLERDRHAIGGVLHRPLGDLTAAPGRDGERVQDLDGGRRERAPDDFGRVVPIGLARLAGLAGLTRLAAGESGGEVLTRTCRVRPGGSFGPAERGADAQQRAQVGTGELAEGGGLIEELADGVGERLAFVEHVPVGRGDLVMLGPGAPVVLRVRLLRGLEITLGLADLLKDMLNVGLQRLLEGAELLVEGSLEPLGLVKSRLRLEMLLALAFDGLGPLGQVFFRARERGALLVQIGRGVLELGGGAGNRIDVGRVGGHAPLGGGLAKLTGPGVGLGDRAVQGDACYLDVFPRLGEQCRLPAGRLGGPGNRSGVGQLAAGAAEVFVQLGGSFGPRGVQPLLRGGGRDALVLLGQPGAAAVGPVGRADVLGDLLGPGADVNAVAELGLRGDEGLAGGRDGTSGLRLRRVAEDVVDAAGDRAGRNVRRGRHDVVSEGDRAEHGDDDVGGDVLLILGDEDVGEGPGTA